MVIYLDNSATTKVNEKVADAVRKIMVEDYGNASSQHGMGRKARKYYAQNLSMDAGVRKFEQIFFKLAKIDITTKRPKIYKN